MNSPVRSRMPAGVRGRRLGGLPRFRLMRILFLNNFYYVRGGSEKVMFEEMRLLREAGHRVEIFSRTHARNKSATYNKFFPPAIETQHVRFSMNSLITAQEMIYSKHARRCLREVIRSFHPDLAHAHNIYGRLSLSVLDALREVGVPVVLTLHDLKLLCPSYLMLHKGSVCERCKGKKFYHAVITRCHKNSYLASFVYALESWINLFFRKYHSVHKFIVPSSFLKRKLVDYGWNESKIVHIPNLIRLDHVPLNRHDGNYLLYMGRLSPEKGVSTLLRAYEHLTNQIPLMIAGDGPERESIKQYVRDKRIPVSFCGYLTGKALSDTIKRAKAVVVPSECYENAPLAILEAFAMGKPVIGTNIGGIPEMIEDGVNGFLFEPSNPAALAERIHRLFALPEDAIISMGVAGREKAEKQFRPERHYELLMEVYSAAIKQPSKISG